MDTGGTDRVFYDGHCGLCHGSVRFLVRRDRRGALRFAPLGGETFAALVPAEERAALPDSIVVVRADGTRLTRGAAAAHLLKRLGGFWGALGGALGVLPRALLDAGYDLVARSRRKLFGTREQACPLLPPELARRFDP